MSDNPPPTHSICPRPKFQFTIRSMLILTAVVAVICSMVFAMPGWSGKYLFGFISVTLPGVLISILFYGTPYQKTFAAGALVPSFISVLYSLDQGSYAWRDTEERLSGLLLWGTAAISGVTAILVRRWLESKKPTDDTGSPGS